MPGYKLDRTNRLAMFTSAVVLLLQVFDDCKAKKKVIDCKINVNPHASMRGQWHCNGILAAQERAWPNNWGRVNGG